MSLCVLDRTPGGVGAAARRLWVVVLVVTGLASALASCAEVTGGFADAGGPCSFDFDCEPGLACRSGFCALPSVVGSDAGPMSSDGGARDGGLGDGGVLADGGGGESDAGPDGGLGNGFGATCRSNADCKSGICIQSSSQGSICSKFCTEDCPPDYGCKVIQIGPSRTAAVCYPGADLYCVQCTNDSCAGPGDRCTQIGGARFCTRDCTASGTCPGGFECVDVTVGPDGGAIAPPRAGDGGVSASDGGAASSDGGPASSDGGPASSDGGPASSDGGQSLADGGQSLADAGATAAGARQCVPVSRLCPGCIDADGDGYGLGADCLGPDCNDNNRAIHPGATEACNGLDDNCDGQVDEGFDLSSDSQNCGACNIRCDSAGGFTCCNGTCVKPTTDPLNCGGCGLPTTGEHICRAGETCCGGGCVNTDTSIDNCGACTTQARPRACLQDGSQLCCAGTCRDIRSDDANCGGCADSTTGANLCRVVFGERCCTGVCRNILAESANCGGCGGAPRTCAAGTEACCNGACTSTIDNDTACGACGNNCTVVPGGNCCGVACFNKLNDKDHCGDACITCTGQQPACCDAACSDLKQDTRNCGACGRTCGVGESCCGGTCKALQQDNNNCGACGRTCGTGQTCCDGQCKNLDSDPNGCGTTCATRRTCTSPSATCCGGACVNTQTDSGNCGRCGGTCSVAGGSKCCAGTCKNVQNGDVNNCGDCGAICALPNTASHTCTTGSCRVATCTGGWSNVDGQQPNGCECPKGGYEPNNSASQAIDLGTLPDSGSSRSVQTRIVPWSAAEGFDVEWFKFSATDTLLGSFGVTITVSGLSGNDYRLTVYRGSPPGNGSSYSCGFLCFGSCSYPASKQARSSGAGSVSISMGEGSLCSDDGGTFWVSIEQMSGAAVCADFTLTVTNG